MAPDEMGPVTDMLTVALASGGTLSVLSTSVRAWLELRRSAVEIEIVHPDGRVSRIAAAGPPADAIVADIVAPDDDHNG
jgi:hypothetical protein